MGGSGGGFFSGRNSPTDLRRQVARADDQARNDEFELEVSSYIDSLLAQANQRDSEVIGKHIETLIDSIEAEIEGSVNLLFGGSIAKHTYVDGLSDVDALIFLNQTELEANSPSEIREYFAQRLRDRLPQSEVKVGQLAVTVTFSDATIQILPALKVGGGIKIPQPDGNAWSSVLHPERFARKLTRINQANNGKLVPTIKLAKVILSQLPDNQKLSGYHVESLAIRLFESYSGEKTTKAMLRHFFTESSRLIRQPIIDSTGQSIHVDDNLGAANSLARRIVADSIARIGRSIQNADSAHSVRQWRDILGGI